MGTHKQRLIEKAKKAKKQGAGARQQLRRDRALSIAACFEENLGSLFEHAVDDWIEFREIRVYIKPDGTPLALLKVRAGGSDHIAFGTGDDWIDALVGLDSSIGSKGMREDKSIKPGKRPASKNGAEAPGKSNPALPET